MVVRPRGALGQSLGVGVPVDRLDPEAAVVRGVDQFAQRLQVPGPAVGGQRHDLVLVAGAQEAQVLGHVLVHEAQGVRQLLRGEHLQLAVAVAAGQVGDVLAPAVAHEHRAVAVRRGQPGRGRVRHVVGDVAHLRRVEPGQCRGQEVGRAHRVLRAQVLPVALGALDDQGRVVGVGDRVDVLGGEACLLQAPGRRLLRQLPGREREGPLAVLAAAEPFLLRGGDDAPVGDDRRGGVVKDRVDAEKSHRAPPTGWRIATERSGSQTCTIAPRCRNTSLVLLLVTLCSC